MPRPIQATIHPAALAANLARARAAAPGARIWAVLKADGYGHGLLRTAAAFAAADGLALLEFDRAAMLRERYPERRILMLEGPFEPADASQAIRERLDIAVHSAIQLDWIEAAAREAGAVPPAIWLKFDSGMHRLGFDGAGIVAARTRLGAFAGSAELGLMSHFANADRPGGIEPAFARIRALRQASPGPCSFANSAAVLASPVAHADWIRPGIMLYGGSPFESRSAASLGLRAGMTLASELIAVRRIEAGESVGYGATFTAPAPMRIGTVACGYADGYPRHAPTGTPVMVGGVRTQLVGRVSMDMLSVDLEPVPRADIGTPVELWGEGVPIDEVAAAAGTIGYELMCALAPRVPLRVAGTDAERNAH
ncbi:MAG: alanine racemase [Burkholderiaceae bacterium]